MLAEVINELKLYSLQNSDNNLSNNMERELSVKIISKKSHTNINSQKNLNNSRFSEGNIRIKYVLLQKFLIITLQFY